MNFYGLEKDERVKWGYRIEGIVTEHRTPMTRVLITKSWNEKKFKVGETYPIHHSFLEKF
jgi:hypothetical protein